VRRGSRIGIGVVAVWLGLVSWHGAGDSATHAPQPEHCTTEARPDATLLLVGDAGAPRTPEPLLEALAAEATAAVAMLGKDRVVIAFLGDNVYPRGLRPADHPGRARDEARLGSQLEVLRRSGARGFFVPGNHDWENGGDAGWEAMQRATRFVAARGALVVPPGGCPGPVSLPLGARAELVFVDTQWWLHAGPRPLGDDSACAARNEAGVAAALTATLRDAGDRHTIVMGHHPLVSGGPHGARFGWQQHLFPLREAHPLAWVPLPIVGSIWPLLREAGGNDQDVAGPAYRRMKEAFEAAFATAPPLVFAAGHDHGLQLIRGTTARFHIVSGAGSAANLTWVHPIADTLFARAAAPGWARLDFDANGGVEATFRTVDETGTTEIDYRACLVPWTR
jgi:hypothetical protein